MRKPFYNALKSYFNGKKKCKLIPRNVIKNKPNSPVSPNDKLISFKLLILINILP